MARKKKSSLVKKVVAKVTKRPKVVKAVKSDRKRTGEVKNKNLDAKRKALPPGKRISKSGKIYYEYRRNRSDIGKV